MKLSKNQKVLWLKRLKIGGLFLGGLVVLSIVLPTIQRQLPRLSPMSISNGMIQSSSFNKSYGGDFAEEAMMDSAMSSRMISPLPPATPGATGSKAEDFEVTEYSSLIHTKDLEEDCQKVVTLKEMEEVIFESQNNHQTSCNFSFKVVKEKTEDILKIIEALGPTELSKNTYTIKANIDRVLNQEEIYENKKQSIEAVLQEALNAYDEISELATRNGDTESLATIISSKVELIERLSREKINADTQLDRLAQNKAEQLDRLKYTRFDVSIFEDKYIDKTQIKESWKNAVKDFFRDLNRMIQELSIGLIGLALVVVQYSILLLLLTYAVKHVWKWMKKIWKS